MTFCPYCNKQITSVNCEVLTGNAGTNRWKVVSHNCPNCHRSLGTQIDPIAIKTDTIKDLKRL